MYRRSQSLLYQANETIYEMYLRPELIFPDRTGKQVWVIYRFPSKSGPGPHATWGTEKVKFD